MWWITSSLLGPYYSGDAQAVWRLVPDDERLPSQFDIAAPRRRLHIPFAVRLQAEFRKSHSRVLRRIGTVVQTDLMRGGLPIFKADPIREDFAGWAPHHSLIAGD